jgi:amino acid transporter
MKTKNNQKKPITLNKVNSSPTSRTPLREGGGSAIFHRATLPVGERMKAIFSIGLITFFFFALTNIADAQTATKLQAFYGWLKPIVNIVLAIATLYAVGKAIVKTFMKHQEAGMEWTMFVIALVLWGLWITFAGEIVAMFGGPAINF